MISVESFLNIRCLNRNQICIESNKGNSKRIPLFSYLLWKNGIWQNSHSSALWNSVFYLFIHLIYFYNLFIQSIYLFNRFILLIYLKHRWGAKAQNATTIFLHFDEILSFCENGVLHKAKLNALQAKCRSMGKKIMKLTIGVAGLLWICIGEDQTLTFS